MILFWFLVVLSVYFEIFCNKICLDAEKMAEKMWKICRKIAFLECYQTPKIIFRTISIAEPNTRISFSLREFTFPAFILHSKFDLHWTKRSLNGILGYLTSLRNLINSSQVLPLFRFLFLYYFLGSQTEFFGWFHFVSLILITN